MTTQKSSTAKKQGARLLLSCFLAFLCSGFVPGLAVAGTVSSFSDALSVHTTSATANHTFQFVTPTGVDAPTDTIAITFSSGFSLASLSSPGDFDLAVGSSGVCSSAIFTDKPLAAAAAAGTWGVAKSGQVVTFTAPTDAAGGEIVAGRCVTIEIGTNATFGVAGANRITNPGTTGSKTIWLGGTFGDSGSLAVAITSPGQVTVNATVTGGAGGGGGSPPPPPPPPDVTPPIISNIATPTVGPTNFTVTWDTDELSNSAVDYGLTNAYEIGTVNNGSNVFLHSVPIGGLTSGTLYHYRVRSTDPSGNTSQSSDQTVSTLVVPDTTAPVISGINVTNITGSSATIGWNTDENSDSKVDYGLTNTYGSNVTNGTAVTAHLLTLTGLTQLTTYHYKVTSKDAANNSASSVNLQFTTIDDTVPVLTGPSVGGLSETGATISWSTNEPTTGLLEYGTSLSYGTNVNTPSSLTHSSTLTGLVQNTTYYYRVTATDPSSNAAQGTGSFQTLPDTTPPASVSGLTATPGNQQVQLAWTNPPDGDFAGVVVRQKTSGAPSGPTDGTLIYQGTNTNFTDTGLVNGTTYFYGVFAKDVYNNFAAGALASGTPAAPPVTPVCGDSLCNGSETNDTCAIDCPAGVIVPVCGDGSCNGAETNAICPADCPLGVVLPFCGDQQCNGAEVNATCPSDCPSGVVIPVCGNATCDVGETFDLCPADCQAPAPVFRDMENFEASDISIIIRNKGITVKPTDDGAYKVLGGSEVLVVVPDRVLAGEVKDATLTVGNEKYAMYKGGSYDAVVKLPAVTGKLASQVHVNYVDGNWDDALFILDVQGPGQVFETVELVSNPLPDTKVTLYEHTDGKHEIQSFVTSGDGTFAFVVTPGTYSVKVEKAGYGPKETPAVFESALVNPRLEIVKIVTIKEILETDAAPIAKAAAVIEQASIQLDIIRDNPVVQQSTEQVVTPAATTVAVVNAATVVTVGVVANAGAGLQYFFLQPFLFFTRRKRKGWGIVYDSLTKMPIDLAVVRLADAATGRLLQSRVTDRMGRYFFIADPGRYRLMVSKPGYVFPSVYMKDAKEDVKYTEIYHSEEIVVTENGQTIAANIPTDPVGQQLIPTKSVIFRAVLRRIQQGIAVAGVVAGCVAAYLNPTTFTIGLLVLQVVLFVIFRQISLGKKPKGWGIVYDKTTNAPLASAVVRIFEPKYNKLLDTYVTDARGRYSFIVGPSVYYTTYERAGYQPSRVENLDYTKTEESAIVNINVPLAKAE